ncbi:hypothetical protein ACMYYO_00670 [Dermacoccaceae bacterium W4C1]
MKRSAAWVAAAVCAGVLAGCSGSEQAAPSSTFQAPTAGATGPTGGSPSAESTPPETTTASESSTASQSSAASSSSASTSIDTDSTAGAPSDLAQQEAAASKFVRAYLTKINQVAADPARVGELDAFVSPNCKSCASLREYYGGWRKTGASQNSQPLEVVSAIADLLDPVPVVLVVIKQNAGEVKDRDGKTIERIEEKRLLRAFELGKSGGSFKINALKTVQGAK